MLLVFWLTLVVGVLGGDDPPAAHVLLAGTVFLGGSLEVDAQIAEFPPTPPAVPLRDVGGYPLAVANPPDGCGSPPSSQPKITGEPFALIVWRGNSTSARDNCTFAEKTRNAKRLGAAVVIVLDTVGAAYNVYQKAVRDICQVDCGVSDGWIPVTTPLESMRLGLKDTTCAKGCPSGVCASTGELRPSGDDVHICCLQDSYLRMASENWTTTGGYGIPAVFVAVTDALMIGNALGLDPEGRGTVPSFQGTVRVARKTEGFPVSAVAVWVVGVFATMLGTWLSGSEGVVRRSAKPLPLTMTVALSYLVMATVSLVVMFFLVKSGSHMVVTVVCFLFGVASVSSVAAVATIPLLRKVCGRLSDSSVTVFGERLEAIPCLGALLALPLVIVWFTTRHSSYSWVLQDILALAVVCNFFTVIRLENAKVATVLLLTFAIFDVFMVFITPLIFHHSVMVTVASAGKGYTRPDPLLRYTCQRRPDDFMPMLLRLPRGDWHGGYALLGLGDVILPGLLLSFLLRFDLVVLDRRYSQGLGTLGRVGRFVAHHPYWTTGVVGYAVGLFLAFLANAMGWQVNGVRGQPALLYLVPLTLGPTWTLAWYKRDAATIWNGPRGLREKFAHLSEDERGQSVVEVDDL